MVKLIAENRLLSRKLPPCDSADELLEVMETSIYLFLYHRACPMRRRLPSGSTIANSLTANSLP